MRNSKLYQNERNKSNSKAHKRGRKQTNSKKKKKKNTASLASMVAPACSKAWTISGFVPHAHVAWSAVTFILNDINEFNGKKKKRKSFEHE